MTNPDSLNIADVRAILARITYKPNVIFRAEPSSVFGLVIEMCVHTLDSRREYPTAAEMASLRLTPEMWAKLDGRVCFSTASSSHDAVPVGLTRRQFDLGGVHLKQMVPVPEWALDGEQRFIDWLRNNVVQRFELHEVDEWLRLDGEHVQNPHPELPHPKALDVLERADRLRGRFVDYPLVPKLPPLLGPFPL